VFLALTPLATAMALIVIGIALPILRNIFNSICIASPFLPLFIWLLDGSMAVFIFSLVIVLALLLRNIPKFTHMLVQAHHKYRARKVRLANHATAIVAGLHSHADE
jgi:hypothetical protein